MTATRAAAPAPGRLARLRTIVQEHGWGSGVEAALWGSGLHRRLRVRYPDGGPEVMVSDGWFSFWKQLEAGRWQRPVLKFVAEQVRPGTTFLDIGAWIGPVSLLAAQRTGPAGRVVAFEPTPATWRALRANLAGAGFDHAEAVNLAVGDTPGTAAFHAPGPMSSTSSMRPLQGAPEVDADGGVDFEARCTTVDAFCAGRGLVPAGIKVDVEGAEDAVLRGARDTLARHRPWLLLELHARRLPPATLDRIWAEVAGPAKRIVYLGGSTEAEAAPGQEWTRPRRPEGTCNVAFLYR